MPVLRVIAAPSPPSAPSLPIPPEPPISVPKIWRKFVAPAPAVAARAGGGVSAVAAAIAHALALPPVPPCAKALMPARETDRTTIQSRAHGHGTGRAAVAAVASHIDVEDWTASAAKRLVIDEDEASQSKRVRRRAARGVAPSAPSPVPETPLKVFRAPPPLAGPRKPGRPHIRCRRGRAGGARAGRRATGSAVRAIAGAAVAAIRPRRGRQP